MQINRAINKGAAVGPFSAVVDECAQSNISNGAPYTYTGSWVGLAVAAAGNTFVALRGGAGKTTRLTRVEVNGTQTTAGAVDLVLKVYRGATTITGGTAAAGNALPVLNANDPNAPAAVSAMNAWTVDPVVGTATPVGIYRAQKLALLGPAAAAACDRIVWTFTDRNSQPIVLQGVNHWAVLDFIGQTAAGNLFDGSFEITEE